MEQDKKKSTMLNAEQVAERPNMSKGFAYKIIQELNEEQVRLVRAVVKGRVRSDHFEERFFAGDNDARLQESERDVLLPVLLPRRKECHEAQGEEGLLDGAGDTRLGEGFPVAAKLK